MRKRALIVNNCVCGQTMEKNPIYSERFENLLNRSYAYGWHDTVYPYGFDRRGGCETYIVFFTVGGEGSLKYKEKNYTLGKNSVAILAPGEAHSYFTEPNKHWEFYWIHLMRNGCENYLNEVIKKRGSVFNIPSVSVLCDYIDNMLDSTYLGIDSEIVISREISLLMHDLVKWVVVRYDYKPDNNNFVKNVADYIARNYMNRITLEAISSEIFLSPCYIIRNFKKYTGYTPYRYLKKYRLMKASDLLRSTSLSVKEIAVMVGYDSPSHFIAEFKAEKNMTPNEFRGVN